MLCLRFRLEYWAVLSFLSLATFVSAQTYVLKDHYQPSNFQSLFYFDNSYDKTNGHVQYVNETIAVQNGYFRTLPNSVYVGVDHTGIYPKGRGRPSVRLVGKQNYTKGLFIADIAHMPGGCGLWPAFWMNGPNWPNNGEIDIIEAANQDTRNNMVLHTSRNCTIAGAAMTGALQRSDCAYYPGYNAGCGIKSNNLASFGKPFNDNGGGIYATEWTSNWIKVWFFPRNQIPATITNGDANPDVSTFGLPTANFQGSCNIDEKFNNHHFVININFCGDWAGAAYSGTTCPKTVNASGWDSCVNYVGYNPTNSTEAYWEFNYIKAYQQNTPVSSISVAPLSSVSPVASSDDFTPPPNGAPDSAIISTSDIFMPASTSVFPSMEASSSAAALASPSSSALAQPPSSSMVVRQSSLSSLALSASSSNVLIVASVTASLAPSSSSVSIPGPDAPVCPASNQTIYNFDNRHWFVECGITYGSCDMSQTGLNAATLHVCIERCAARSGCVYANWFSGKCYEKSCLGTKAFSQMAQGGRVVNGDGSTSTPPISSSSQAIIMSSPSRLGMTSSSQQSLIVPPQSSSSAGGVIDPPRSSSAGGVIDISSSSSAGGLVIVSSWNGVVGSSSMPQASSMPPIPSTVPIACPQNNQTTYITVNGTYRIDCGMDYAGTDIAGYGELEANFLACVDKCSTIPTCLVVTYANGRCYPKSAIRSVSFNVNRNSAYLIARASNPASSLTISAATSPVAGSWTIRISSSSLGVVAGSSSVSKVSSGAVSSLLASSSRGNPTLSPSTLRVSSATPTSSAGSQVSSTRSAASLTVSSERLSSSVVFIASVSSRPAMSSGGLSIISSLRIQSSTEISVVIVPSSSARNVQSNSDMVSSSATILASSSHVTGIATAITTSPATLLLTGSQTASKSASVSSSGAFSTVAVDLMDAQPDDRVSISRDPVSGTTFAEFIPSSANMSVALTLQISGTSTTVLQRLVFLLANDGYYFGKVKRLLERQLPRGCALHIFYAGQEVFTIDIAELFAEYQQFKSNAIFPNATDTAITFNETCQDTTTFPTLRLANVSIEYQGLVPASSNTVSNLMSASTPMSSGQGFSSIQFASGASMRASIFGSVTSQTVSASSLTNPASIASLSRTRRTVTITHSTCSPRSVRTIFTTVTTQCPATCAASNAPASPSSTPSGTCVSTLYGSLCYNCYLTPTVVVTTCTDSPSMSSASRTVSSGRPSSSDAPDCPFEPSGRLFLDPLGRIYALYCGLVYDDPDIDVGSAGAASDAQKRQDGAGLSEARLKVSSMLDCIMACDNYNLAHFKSASPCKGISYSSDNASPNCFLKASVNLPRAINGFDSARLITLDPPPDNNNTITVTTTVFSGILSIVYTGGGSRGTGGNNPGVTATVTGNNPGVTATITGGGGGPTITVPGGSGHGTMVSTVTSTETIILTTSIPGISGGPGGLTTITQTRTIIETRIITVSGPTITEGSGGSGGPGGTGPVSGFGSLTAIVYTVSMSTSIQTQIVPRTTTELRTTTDLRVQFVTILSTTVSISRETTVVSGTPTTVVTSIPVTQTYISTSASTTTLTVTQKETLYQISISLVPVPVTIYGSGGGGGVVTVTVGGGSTRNPFLCYSTSMYFLRKRQAAATPAVRIMDPRFNEAMRLDMQAWGNQ